MPKGCGETRELIRKAFNVIIEEHAPTSWKQALIKVIYKTRTQTQTTSFQPFRTIPTFVQVVQLLKT